VPSFPRSSSIRRATTTSIPFDVSPVFAAFDKHRQTYSDVSVLPTPAKFYGLRLREEISVEIEPGKTLIIRLINVSERTRMGAGRDL